jgi:hypothetical protein
MGDTSDDNPYQAPRTDQPQSMPIRVRMSWFEIFMIIAILVFLIALLLPAMYSARSPTNKPQPFDAGVQQRTSDSDVD